MKLNKWFWLISVTLLLFSTQSNASIVVGSQNFPLQRSVGTADQINSQADLENKMTGFMLFQVIKDQMVFDFSNIKSASLIEQNGHFKGLLIELKKPGMIEIEGITSAGLGKPANLIFNKKIVSTTIIQSPLGGSILISGLSKEDAQLFLRSLNSQKR